MVRFRFAAAVTMAAAGAGCVGERGALENRADSASLVTLLGVDTLVLERLVTTPSRVVAEALVRSPRTSYRRYVLDREPDGTSTRLTVERYEGVGEGMSPTVVQTLERSGDSVHIETRRDGEVTLRVVAAGPEAFPFPEDVAWPFDAALRRLESSEADSLTLSELGDPEADERLFYRQERGRTAVVGPEGAREATVDSEGRLLSLAGDPVAARRVERGPWLDLEASARHFAALDTAGLGLGPLSGRAESVVRVGRGQVRVDYGAPHKRGRAIWGALVPYGEVWRTGANLATHLETDQDLRIGDLEVPKGRYTLFTIPDRARTLLVINRQTDQPGTEYDESQDLGRVEMQHRVLASPVEVFDISVGLLGSTGALSIRWDRLELVTPLEVR